MNPPKLYHYTCTHARKRIGAEGVLRPHRHPLLDTSYVWLTTNPRPAREHLGLTSRTLPCDRLAVRYVVTPITDDPLDPRWFRLHQWGDVSWWYEPQVVAELEALGRPDQWWVSEDAVPVKLDRTWKGAR